MITNLAIAPTSWQTKISRGIKRRKGNRYLMSRIFTRLKAAVIIKDLQLSRQLAKIVVRFTHLYEIRNAAVAPIIMPKVKEIKINLPEPKKLWRRKKTISTIVTIFFSRVNKISMKLI